MIRATHSSALILWFKSINTSCYCILDRFLRNLIDGMLGFEGRHKVDEMFEARLPAITIEVNFEGAEGSER